MWQSYMSDPTGTPEARRIEIHSPLVSHFRPMREGMSQKPSVLCEG